MTSKNTKIFTIDNSEYQFNFSAFNIMFNKHCQFCRIKKGDFEEELAEKLNVSSSAVHNWRNINNGPSELEMIKILSDIFKIEYKNLLKEIGKDIPKMKYEQCQLESIKRIYDAIIIFLEKFLNTDGFNELWIEFIDKGINNEFIEDKLYDYAMKQIDNVNLILKQEYFYLHNLSIYDNLNTFINDDLINTFDGKLSYAYRFESLVEDNNGNRGTTTSEDYLKALNKINGIIEEITRS